MNPEQQKERGSSLTLPQLKDRFDVYMQEKKSNSVINKKRNEILEQCRQKGKCSPGSRLRAGAMSE